MGGKEAEIEIVPAAAEYWNLLSDLFAGSPGVNRCWCMWPLRPPTTHQPDHSRNKTQMRSLIISGVSPGLLALVAGRAVGWCACGPRRKYPQYANLKKRSSLWAIPCLYIGPSVDRQAVAEALIEKAAELATQHAAEAIDGPPPWWLPGDAAAIAVTTRTFLDKGFVQIGPGARMPELRRMLA